MRRLRRNLWTALADRATGLRGDLTAQLAADLDAASTERRPLPLRRVRYVELVTR